MHEVGDQDRSPSVLGRRHMGGVYAMTPESATNCPSTLQQVFANLRSDIRKQFPDNAHLELIGVSSFIFLRFFNAAILVRRVLYLKEIGE